MYAFKWTIITTYLTPFARPSKQQTCNGLLDIFTSINKWCNTFCYCFICISSAGKSVELLFFQGIQGCPRAATRTFCIHLNANDTKVWLPDTNTHPITILTKEMWGLLGVGCIILSLLGVSETEIATSTVFQHVRKNLIYDLKLFLPGWMKQV